MNEDKKVLLSTMRDRLQKRMNYAHPAYAFTALLCGYARKKKYFSGWAGRMLRRGWVSQREAREIAEYVGYPIDKS